MKLTFEQVKAVTVGSIRTEMRDGGIHFAKCTESQVAAWKRKSDGLGKNSSATTGVRLDFHTNSQNLSFRVLGGRKYEVKVDGLTFAHYVLNSGDAVSVALSDGLGNKKDEYRVTLVLPSHDSPGVLEYVELDDGAFVRPHEFDMKMLFIGDSITQGWASTRDTLSYAYRVSDFFNAESVIQGTGGAYFNEESFDHIDFDPDIVFVSYGTNDFGHYKTYDDLRIHCDAHLALIAEEYKDKKIFVISPIWREHREGKAMGTFEECRRIIIDIAEKYGMIHIDGLTLVPPLPEFFQDEYLHPNDNGFSLYAENLIKKIQKYM